MIRMTLEKWNSTPIERKKLVFNTRYIKMPTRDNKFWVWVPVQIFKTIPKYNKYKFKNSK